MPSALPCLTHSITRVGASRRRTPVAPRKTDPWVPKEYGALSIRQTKQKLEEVERQEASADREFRMAILRWLLEPEGEENIKEFVLPRVEKAMELDPENLGYVYSAATLHKKVRSFQKAIELFSKYAAQARQSWWTKKAIELCGQCR